MSKSKYGADAQRSFEICNLVLVGDYEQLQFEKLSVTLLISVLIGVTCLTTRLFFSATLTLLKH